MIGDIAFQIIEDSVFISLGILLSYE